MLLPTFTVGGDTAFISGPFHFEEVASKAWYHTISSYSLRGLGLYLAETNFLSKGVLVDGIAIFRCS